MGTTIYTQLVAKKEEIQSQKNSAL